MIVKSAYSVDQELGITEDSYSEANSEKFIAYVVENKAHYYARPKESYSEEEAIKEALEVGAEMLILDNLS